MKHNSPDGSLECTLKGTLVEHSSPKWLHVRLRDRLAVVGLLFVNNLLDALDALLLLFADHDNVPNCNAQQMVFRNLLLLLLSATTSQLDERGS